jgi:hypothetical protein
MSQENLSQPEEARKWKPQTEQEKVDKLLGKFEHPLQSPEVLAYIKKEYPEHAAALDEATVTLPVLSKNADPLELWEVWTMLMRRERWVEQVPYLRTMMQFYEESFGINQVIGMGRDHPLLQEHKSTGYTPGGLISHFIRVKFMPTIGKSWLRSSVISKMK